MAFARTPLLALIQPLDFYSMSLLQPVQRLRFFAVLTSKTYEPIAHQKQNQLPSFAFSNEKN